MKWGTIWGKLWGVVKVIPPLRIPVRSIRGKIIPCNHCKRVYRCAMYHSLTRHRLRNNEYMGGTNILHHCEIYTPDKLPRDIKAPIKRGRTSGRKPT